MSTMVRFRKEVVSSSTITTAIILSRLFIEPLIFTGMNNIIHS
jgi:hypothetical protein